MDLLLTALALAPLGSPQAPPSGVEERLRAELDALHERGSFPGASLAVVLPDGRELALAVGVSEGDVELTPAHRMLSGSVGKIYVTAAAHHLVEAGKLELDALAASFFDEDEEWLERVPNARSITVRQCLRHETGIPRYVFAPSFWEALLAEPDRRWEPRELLQYVFDDDPLFVPGEGWAYADTNYIVVGMVLEKVAGVSFYDYVREHLLEPHAFRDTIASDTRELAGMAQGHVVQSLSFGVGERTLDAEGVFTFNPQFEWTGGGWANTPADLARFSRLLYSGTAFEGDYLASMLETTPAPMLGPERAYGLGVITTPTDAGTMYGHDGFMPGYITATGYVPELGVAAAIQVNTDDGRAVGAPLYAVLRDLLLAAGDELATARSSAEDSSR